LFDDVVYRLFSRISSAKSFAQNSPLFAFIYSLYRIKAISLTRASKFIRDLISDSASLYSGWWLYCYFAPEFQKTDRLLAHTIASSVRDGLEHHHFPEILKVIGHIIKSRRGSLLRHCRNYFNSGASIASDLLRDDVSGLRERFLSPRLNVDYRLPSDPYAPSIYLQDHPSLVHAAAFFGSVNCFRFLVANGAELQSTDDCSRTLPEFAVAGGNIEIIRRCQQESLDFSGTAHAAIAFHRNEIFDWLYEGVSSGPNDVDRSGDTLLHAASYSNNVYAMKRLLEFGADPTIPSMRGRSVLRTAIDRCHFEAVRILLDTGKIDVNERNR
jgi:hypothetical protein